MKHLVFISGATAGIGYATAVHLAQSGYDLILHGRRADRLEELKNQLSSICEVHSAPFDIKDRSQVTDWFRKNSKLTERISVLINNAGLARGVDPVDKASVDDWDEMIDTNLRGLLLLTKLSLPSVIKHKGHIINIGSVAGRWTYPGGSVYSATKFAVRALSESFRMDLLGKGVRVTNIEPGMVETEFSEVRLQNKDLAKKVYEGMRALKPEDIAETIGWSLTRPPHVNIQELVIFPTDQASVRDVFRS